MCIWDGSPIQPEDERESEWHDSEDADQSWRGEEHPDPEAERFPGENEAGGDYWLLRGMAKAEDEDEKRNRRRRRRDDPDNDGA